jgi:hypothetical protein
MSDEQIRNHDMSDHGGFEHEDLSPNGVIYFMIGLAVVVVVIYFIVFGMYRFLDTYEKAHQPAMSPMVTPQADTRTIGHSDTQVFPQPRLEENERMQLREIIEDEDRKLATYNWVDKDKGVVQIPIDRAMDLIVERGLPVRPGNSESTTAAQTSTLTEPTQKEKKRQTPKPAASKAAKHGN